MGLHAMKNKPPPKFLKRAFYWLVPALILFGPGLLYGSQTTISATGNLRVIYDEPLEASAREAERLYPAVKKHLEETFGWKVDFVPTLVLIKDQPRFQRVAGNPSIMAFAVPGKNLMVLNHSKTARHPSGLDKTMTHELCHLLLHHHIRRGNLPRWLDEGIAQWASGGMAEILVRPDKSLLHRLVIGRGPVSIRKLSQGFQRQGEPLFLAYEMSRSFVEYIVREFGIEGLLGVLTRLKEGEPWEVAFEQAFSMPFDELEAEWLSHLKRRMTWFTYLSYHLYEILFALGALLMVYGSIRAFLKKRRYMAEAEDEPNE